MTVPEGVVPGPRRDGAHAAARAGSVSTVNALVAGDDRLVRALDSNGSLAVLHAAAMAAVCAQEHVEGYTSVIRLLLAVGAGSEIRNVFGVSANDYMHAVCARADVSSAVHELQDVTSTPVRVRRTLPRLFGPLGRPGVRPHCGQPCVRLPCGGSSNR